MAGGGGSFWPNDRWVVDIEKSYQGEYWTNRYCVQATTLAAAHAIGLQICTIERSIHNDAILFNRVRTSDNTPNTDVYQIGVINAFGTVALAGNQLLPLFNVVRCDFNTEGGGRPSRKFLRGYLFEAAIDFNTIGSAYISSVQTNYVNALVGLAGFVDVDGQEIVSGSVHPFVGMRQLRRGSKRKAPATGTAG